VVRTGTDGIRFTPGDILQVIVSCDPLTLLSGGFTVAAERVPIRRELVLSTVLKRARRQLGSH
jgi:hypothetical protein